jgi:hypothetical protein
MARPVDRPDFGEKKPFNYTIDVEEAFSYLDDFKQSSDYPKTSAELGLRVPYTPNKFQILGDRLRGKFGIDTVEARNIVGMWLEKNNSIKNENKKNMKRRVVKLNESDLERLVQKIIKEDLEGWQKSELEDLHDEVLYLTPGYGRLKLSKSVSVYEEIMGIISSNDIPDEVKPLVRRLEYDLSALEGFNERVVELYNALTGENL